MNRLHALDCDIRTYIGHESKGFKQMSTGIILGNRIVFVPLLVNGTFDIVFEVTGMNEVISKFKQNNISLLDETFSDSNNHEIIAIHMLLGMDAI